MAKGRPGGNPGWKKGQSGNPKGRPKAGEQFGDLLSTYMMKKARKEGDKHWLEHVVEMAWNDSRLMTAVLKKLIPDKVTADIQGKIEVCWIGEGGDPVQAT